MFNAQKSLLVAYYAIFVGLLLLEALVVKRAVSQAISSNTEQEPVRKTQVVRVEFDLYKESVNKIRSGQNFTPSYRQVNNPFRTR